MNHLDQDFEGELKARLRRVVPPPSFTGTVMDRIADAPRPVLSFPQPKGWLGRLAALLLVTAALAGLGVTSHHRREAERIKAERDFARSRELTSRALEPVRQRLRQAGIALDE